MQSTLTAVPAIEVTIVERDFVEYSVLVDCIDWFGYIFAMTDSGKVSAWALMITGK